MFQAFLGYVKVLEGVPGFLGGVPGCSGYFRRCSGVVPGFFLEGVPGTGFFTLFPVFRGVPGCSGVPCSGVPGITTCPVWEEVQSLQQKNKDLQDQ